MTRVTAGLFGAMIMIVFSTAHAQVTLSPVAVFMDEQDRFATLTISNTSNSPQEVSLEFVFGYPAVNEEGRSYMNYDDPDAEEKFSIADWVRAFPRSMVIPPHESQVVRLTVRPPSGLDAGTYWTRIKVVSLGEAPDLDEPEEGGVGARMQFRFEQVITALYKTGDTYVSVEIESLEVETEDDKLVATASLKRGGNSPFMGTFLLTIFDENGNEVGGRRQLSSLYFDSNRYFEIHGHGLEPGTYEAELTLKTQRGDMSSSDLVQGETVSRRVGFTID